MGVRGGSPRCKNPNCAENEDVIIEKIRPLVDVGNPTILGAEFDNDSGQNDSKWEMI